MKKIILLLIVLLQIPEAGKAQSSKTAAILALEAELTALKKDPGLKHAAWSVYVQNINTGAVEAEYNSQMSLIPASIQKMITTTTALALLGADFRFETRLQMTGILDTLSGTLHGNLYLVGGGDPTLGSKRFGKQVNADSVFSKFVASLRQKGIKAIDGYLFADESIFDDLIPQSWSYEDIGNYYASPVGGLTIAENMYRLYFNAGANIGDSAELVRMEPELPEITFINMVKTGAAGSGDQVFILGSPYTYFRLLDGTVPLGKKNFDVDGAMPDPGKYCLELFHQRILDAGITLTKTATTLREQRWTGGSPLADTTSPVLLASYFSPSLEEIIHSTNQFSVNLFAEAILKMLGRKQHGEGSTHAGLMAVREYWSANGIDLKGFEIFDGSGLSRKNRFTGQQLGKMLVSFYAHKEYKVFSESLPVAGKSGMMAGYLKGTVAEGNLIAKSGVLEGVRTYAGYVKNTAGENLVFVIMMNNYTCSPWELKTKCERLMLKIAETD